MAGCYPGALSVEERNTLAAPMESRTCVARLTEGCPPLCSPSRCGPFVQKGAVLPDGVMCRLRLPHVMWVVILWHGCTRVWVLARVCALHVCVRVTVDGVDMSSLGPLDEAFLRSEALRLLQKEDVRASLRVALQEQVSQKREAARNQKASDTEFARAMAMQDTLRRVQEVKDEVEKHKVVPLPLCRGCFVGGWDGCSRRLAAPSTPSPPSMPTACVSLGRPFGAHPSHRSLVLRHPPPFPRVLTA